MFLIWLLLLVLLQYRTSGDMVDRESFLARAEARRLIHSLITANDLHIVTQLNELMFAFSVFPSASLAEFIAREWEKAGMMNHLDQALLWYEKTLSLNNTNKHALLTVGIAHHRAGKYLTAMELFARLVSVDEHDMDGWFHLGLTMQHYGDIQRAAEYYERCLAANEHHVRARINLASLHHQHGLLADAFVHYEILLQQFHAKHTEALAAAPTSHNMVIPAPEYSMVKLNYVVALLQDGYHTKGKDTALSFVRELEVTMSMFDCFRYRVGHTHTVSEEVIVMQCTAWQRDIDAAQSHILNIQKRYITLSHPICDTVSSISNTAYHPLLHQRTKLTSLFLPNLVHLPPPLLLTTPTCCSPPPTSPPSPPTSHHPHLQLTPTYSPPPTPTSHPPCHHHYHFR